MKTVQERIRTNKIIVIAFLIIGLAMAIFLAAQKVIAEKQVKEGAETARPAGSYKIDFEGNVEYRIDGVKYYGEEYIDSDIKLPNGYYKFLSAKETMLTKIIHFLSGDVLPDDAYYLNCKKVDDGLYILYNGEKRGYGRIGGYGLTDGEGHWILEPEYQTIWTESYDEYGFLELVNNYNSYAFVDRNGHWILEPGIFYKTLYIDEEESIIRYSYSFFDEEHLGFINERCGAYDLKGNKLYEISGKKVTNIGARGFFIVETGEKTKLVDCDGNDIIKEDCKDIDARFCKGLSDYIFIARDMDGKYYICDSKGNELTSHEYDSYKFITGDGFGAIIVKKDGEKGIIDVNGKELLNIEYSDVQYIEPDRKQSVPDSQSAFFVESVAGQIGLFTLEDGFLIEPQSILANDSKYYYSYEDKVLYFYKGKHIHVVLRHDKEPLKIECNELYIGTKGVLVTGDYVNEGKDYLYTLLDLDGNILYSEKAQDIYVTSIDNKLRIVIAEPESQGGGYKFIYDGKETFKCGLEQIKSSSFDDEMYAVCDDNGKYGLINDKGEIILDYQYEDIGVVPANYSHEMFIIVKNSDEQYGVLDEKLQWIYKPQFDYVAEKYDGLEVTLREGQEIIK